MQNYMQCLKVNNGDSMKCKEAAKEYIVCRMDKYVSQSKVHRAASRLQPQQPTLKQQQRDSRGTNVV